MIAIGSHLDATIISENVLILWINELEGQVSMLLYLILENLYDASLVLEDFSNCSRIPPIIKRLNSHSL